MSEFDPLVDKISRLQARLAPFNEKLEAWKSELKAKGKGEYHANWYQATVSTFVTGYLNLDAVRAKLSKKFIKANTTYKDITKLTITPRK